MSEECAQCRLIHPYPWHLNARGRLMASHQYSAECVKALCSEVARLREYYDAVEALDQLESKYHPSELLHDRRVPPLLERIVKARIALQSDKGGSGGSQSYGMMKRIQTSTSSQASKRRRS